MLCKQYVLLFDFEISQKLKSPIQVCLSKTLPYNNNKKCYLHTVCTVKHWLYIEQRNNIEIIIHLRALIK